MQKRRFATLPALLFAVGLGMLMFYGHAWWRLPHYSADDIEQSVELNLAIDLQRRGSSGGFSPEQVERLRAQVRNEVLAAIAADEHEALRYLGIGLLLTVMGLAQMWLLSRMAAR